MGRNALDAEGAPGPFPETPVVGAPGHWQTLIPGTEAPRTPRPRKARVKLPICRLCAAMRMDTKRHPAPGGRWACAQGHGLLGGEKAP